MLLSTFEGAGRLYKILEVPRGLQRFVLRDGDVAVGARGVGRVAERKPRIRRRGWSRPAPGNVSSGFGAGGRLARATSCSISSFQRSTPPRLPIGDVAALLPGEPAWAT